MYMYNSIDPFFEILPRIRKIETKVSAVLLFSETRFNIYPIFLNLLLSISSSSKKIRKKIRFTLRLNATKETIDRDISSIHKIYKDFNKVSLHRTLLFLRSLVIVGLNYILLTRDELIRPLRKKIQQLVVIHAVQRLYVYAERVRNALHVETEALQQLDEVHFLTGERVVQLRAAVITLRPSAAFD